MAKVKPELTKSYSIAEWYGSDFTKLSSKERKKLADIRAPKGKNCPFSPGDCNKKGGVCSIRCYTRGTDENWVTDSEPVATCPRRFQQNDTVIEWVGEIMIGEKSPLVVEELPFLAGIGHDGEDTGNNVGKIDMVLVAEDRRPMEWCAVEVQAVYFSGAKMGLEFSHLKKQDEEGIPAPQGRRRPDFRSSGPKRLMPQLQTKVPSISRWGHKMAVVIDRAFWMSLSPMEQVSDVSNCDVAWFVIDYDIGEEGIVLKRGDLYLTTLARAVEGLTAGRSIPLEEFERALDEKLSG